MRSSVLKFIIVLSVLSQGCEGEAEVDSTETSTQSLNTAVVGTPGDIVPIDEFLARNRHLLPPPAGQARKSPQDISADGKHSKTGDMRPAGKIHERIKETIRRTAKARPTEKANIQFDFPGRKLVKGQPSRTLSEEERATIVQQQKAYLDEVESMSAELAGLSPEEAKRRKALVKSETLTFDGNSAAMLGASK